MATTSDEVLAAFNKAFPDSKCAFCGDANLSLISNDGVSAGKFAVTAWGNMSRGLPLYAIGCQNCGHIHFVGKKVIDKRLGIKDDAKGIEEE